MRDRFETYVELVRALELMPAELQEFDCSAFPQATIADRLYMVGMITMVLVPVNILWHIAPMQ